MSATISGLGAGAAAYRRDTQLQVLIVDDHAWLADICASVVRNWSTVQCSVVATTMSDAMLHAGYDWYRVFVHLTSACADSLSVVRALARYGLAERLCVVTAAECHDTLSEVRKLGVLAYVPASMSVSEFLSALCRVMEGTSVLPKDAEPLPRLSDRQMGVLRLLQAGLSSKQIAHALCIAEGTAKNHTSAVLKMLGAANRAHAVARAIELGLLSAR